MFNDCRDFQYFIYQDARRYFINNHHILIKLEKFITSKLYEMINKSIQQIVEDYNEASYLYPFWQNYPPEERGRQPIGDQYPWIEVGEHAIGDKIPRLMAEYFGIRDVGLPTGSDVRLVLQNNEIHHITNGLTDKCWLFLDIKSVGPRDDQDHAVMSHNQISGSGKWDDVDNGIQNDVIVARGSKASHLFHCSVPPFYVLSDKTIVPVVIIILKPVYKMLSLKKNSQDGGQPLQRISVATVPNGLLLHENPHYLAHHPQLFFPGKDDKTKNPLKVRCRVSFKILRGIDNWRFQEIKSVEC
ncbi:BglI family type II restriction endonuclease [Cronbergia sp. UHCC 0137]|uniref:BglI family type II restriction endonuclease n=1 Tax=Cronbergia sp. UHCC 0137 TaxID=3110239 RepID=UPI002B214E0E|nr:BglI family type II restriction endonuclease [Cronbergia sp. UHCC 0137]MEA5620868.1 BglI family type II restriction endonuclease [Cronbergia sp. UHCC 0137]